MSENESRELLRDKPPELFNMIAAAIVASTLIGCFSYAWKVTEQMATTAEQLRSTAQILTEIRIELSTTKEKYDERFRDLEEKIHSKGARF